MYVHDDNLRVTGSLHELSDIAIKKLHINRSIGEKLGGEIS